MHPQIVILKSRAPVRVHVSYVWFLSIACGRRDVKRTHNVVWDVDREFVYSRGSPFRDAKQIRWVNKFETLDRIFLGPLGVGQAVWPSPRVKSILIYGLFSLVYNFHLISLVIGSSCILFSCTIDCNCKFMFVLSSPELWLFQVMFCYQLIDCKV